MQISASQIQNLIRVHSLQSKRQRVEKGVSGRNNAEVIQISSEGKKQSVFDQTLKSILQKIVQR